VVEISLDDRARIHIDRIVFALDCGIALNPDLVRAQVEGGILFGLGAAVWGDVVLGEGGDIVTQNFDRYEVMRMRTTPEIEVHLIDSLESPGGVGEVSVPSVAPALANAIAALTGTRVRRLPFSKSVKIRRETGKEVSNARCKHHSQRGRTVPGVWPGAPHCARWSRDRASRSDGSLPLRAVVQQAVL
jgi:isoquinoline 1-oxidoreductase beta subunit